MVLDSGLDWIWDATANPLHLLEMVLPSKMSLDLVFGRVVFGRCFCLLVLGSRVLYFQGISTAPGSGSAQAPLDNSNGAAGSSELSPYWSCGVTADRGAGRPGSAFLRSGPFCWIAVALRP